MCMRLSKGPAERKSLSDEDWGEASSVAEARDPGNIPGFGNLRPRIA